MWIDEAVDIPVTVDVLCNGPEGIVHNDRRNTITTYSNPPWYVIALEISPLEVKDNGSYQCHLYITPSSDYVLPFNGSLSFDLLVEGEHTQVKLHVHVACG